MVKSIKKIWKTIFHPIRDYIQFFAKFNVLGLAIGLMIGSNLKDVASVFIDDVLMPFIAPLLLLAHPHLFLAGMVFLLLNLLM